MAVVASGSSLPEAPTPPVSLRRLLSRDEWLRACHGGSPRGQAPRILARAAVAAGSGRLKLSHHCCDFFPAGSRVQHCRNRQGIRLEVTSCDLKSDRVATAMRPTLAVFSTKPYDRA